MAAAADGRQIIRSARPLCGPSVGWTVAESVTQALADAVYGDAPDDLVRLMIRNPEAIATALQIAIEYGRSSAVEILIAAGRDNIELRPMNGLTPLMWASKVGNLEAVRVLLDAGANPNATDVAGWSPLFFAVRSQHLRVVRELIDRGASLDLRDCEGHSALDVASAAPPPRGPLLPGATRRGFVDTPVASYLRLRLKRSRRDPK